MDFGNNERKRRFGELVASLGKRGIICHTEEEYLAAVKNAKEGQTIIFDEAGITNR